MANKKLIGAVLGALMIGAPAFAADQAPATDAAPAPAKTVKATKKHSKHMKKATKKAAKKDAAEKSCSGDKGCSGK